jgi:hypothetical protein
MENDFIVCRDGEPCRRQQFGQQPGSESAAIVRRLEALMRRCREDGHRLVYQDLVEVRGAAGCGRTQ